MIPHKLLPRVKLTIMQWETWKNSKLLYAPLKQTMIHQNILFLANLKIIYLKNFKAINIQYSNNFLVKCSLWCLLKQKSKLNHCKIPDKQFKHTLLKSKDSKKQKHGFLWKKSIGKIKVMLALPSKIIFFINFFKTYTNTVVYSWHQPIK